MLSPCLLFVMLSPCLLFVMLSPCLLFVMLSPCLLFVMLSPCLIFLLCFLPGNAARRHVSCGGLVSHLQSEVKSGCWHLAMISTWHQVSDWFFQVQAVGLTCSLSMEYELSNISNWLTMVIAYVLQSCMKSVWIVLVSDSSWCVSSVVVQTLTVSAHSHHLLVSIMYCIYNIYIWI